MEEEKIKVQAYERMNMFYIKNYKKTLLEVCAKLGYSEQNLEIIACPMTDEAAKKKLYKKYRTIIDSFCKTELGREIKGNGMNVLEYFKDIIAGWTGEDLFVRALNRYGINAKINNTDKARQILPTDGQTYKADIIATVNGVTRKIELMQECCGFITNSGYSETVVGKFDEMHREKSVFINRDLEHNKYIIIDFAEEDIIFHRVYHKKLTKFVDRYNLNENNKILRDMKCLWGELIVTLSQSPSGENHKFIKIEGDVSGIEQASKLEENKVEHELQPKPQPKPVENPIDKPKTPEPPKANAETVKPVVKPVVKPQPNQQPKPQPKPPVVEQDFDPTYGWA